MEDAASRATLTLGHVGEAGFAQIWMDGWARKDYGRRKAVKTQVEESRR